MTEKRCADALMRIRSLIKNGEDTRHKVDEIARQALEGRRADQAEIRRIMCIGKPKHGHSQSPEYRIWQRIKRRCYYDSDLVYANYGGRGIQVAKEWHTDFEAFLRYVGPRPTPDHSLDRIDLNGHYEPGNVRWATMEEQQRNKSNNRRLTLNGETLCIAEWSDRTGLSQGVIGSRLKAGWSVEEALTVPSGAMPRGPKKRTDRYVEQDTKP